MTTPHEAGEGDAKVEPSHEPSVEELVHEVEAVEHENRPPAAGPRANVATAVAVIALGVAAFVGALGLGIGTADDPGAGTWPLLVSAVLVILGVVLLATVRGTTDAERFSRTSWLVVAGLATMVVFVALIDVVGFELPAALLCFVWLRFLGRESWRTSIITSVLVVVGFYLVFVAALAVPIPHLF